MGTAERRHEIMRLLYRRRYETVSNLAEEFGVSKRTILRDINVLSDTEPIYTQCGKHGGGVYIIEDYRMERMYMTEEELAVLHKLSYQMEKQLVCELSEEEKRIFHLMISQYTKPKNKKGKKK